MQTKKLIIGLAILLTCSTQLSAQYAASDTSFKRCFLGSTLFLLGNLSTTNPPSFFQLNLGYRLTAKDVISLEPKTWKYAWPNGIHPFLNKAYGKPEEQFPGYIREYGISLAYQHFYYKGFYAELNLMPTWQRFFNPNGTKINDGFQLFNTYRLGYHIKLFKDKFFLQPSLAITHRAYHTQLPAGFKQLDDKWPKFIFAEPGLHFGYNF